MTPAKFVNDIVRNILNEDLCTEKNFSLGGTKNTLKLCIKRNIGIGKTVVEMLTNHIIKHPEKKDEIFKYLEQYLTEDEISYMYKNPTEIKTIIKFATKKINTRKKTRIPESGKIKNNLDTSSTQNINTYPLKVVIGLVIHDDKILLVKRRDSESNLVWQFPAGILKKNKLPEIILEREVKSETNVICKVISPIGNRVHPDTQVICKYYLCEYLSGEAINADFEENEDVQWVNINNYEKYITSDIYIKVKNVLEKIKNNEVVSK